MKVIYKIAKAELQMLFYSPIAWLLLLCFIVQTGITFAKFYEIFYSIEGNVYMASSTLFVSGIYGSGLWYLVQSFLYLYIPLLTMGIVSKEYSSGSVKLLYASPISTAQIILGKFFALVTYAILMMLVLFVYVVIAWCTIEHFELAWALTGLLGLFLLACTYMAVGIFVSSLTSYQVIAAVGTFVVLMLLSWVGGWGQQYDVVREITYWLSINGRASTFIQGMICTEDLIYFPTISAMFIVLTIIRLNAVRQKQRFTLVVGKYLSVVVVVCAVAYLSSRPALMAYADTTHNKENTLTPVSQEIVDKVDGGMTVTAYVNLLDQSYWSCRYPGFILEHRNYFRYYTRFNPRIKLKVVYYYAEPDKPYFGPEYAHLSLWEQARKACEMYGMDSTKLISKEEVDRMVDLSEEGYGFVQQIVRDNGQKEWLRVPTTQILSEAEISVALKRMVMKLPKIAFIAGQGERGINDTSPEGYRRVAGDRKVLLSVWNQGFDVEEVYLDHEVPEDIEILVLADPKRTFTPEEKAFLRSYVDKGRNLIVLGEARNREALNPFLREYFGLELTPMLVQEDVRFKGLPVNVLYCLVQRGAQDKLRDLSRTRGLTFPSVAGVEQVEDKGYSVFPVALTDTLSPAWTELETTDFLDDTVKFNPAIGEVSKRFATALGLTRKVGGKEQRIVVVGDADALSNNEFMTSRTGRSQNETLILGSCYWLSEGKAPLDVSRPMATDNKVHLTGTSEKVIRGCVSWAIPLLVLGMAVYVWVRRRGR